MYLNERGELVIARTYTNQAGETIKQYKTYQNNGWVRTNEIYPDGTTTEAFDRE